MNGREIAIGTKWRAVVPLKRSSDRKTRLSPVLSSRERGGLADHMALHVIEQLRASTTIKEVIVLAPHDVMLLGARWVRDNAHGLNVELDRLRRGLGGPIVVVHADLPFLQRQEVDLLLDEARLSGSAIAPDRHGEGTNALALLSVEQDFTFAFGPGSCARHRASLGERAVLVEQPGLAFDIDTADDLSEARRQGFTF